MNDLYIYKNISKHRFNTTTLIYRQFFTLRFLFKVFIVNVTQIESEIFLKIMFLSSLPLKSIIFETHHDIYRKCSRVFHNGAYIVIRRQSNKTDLPDRYKFKCSDPVRLTVDNNYCINRIRSDDILLYYLTRFELKNVLYYIGASVAVGSRWTIRPTTPHSPPPLRHTPWPRAR